MIELASLSVLIWAYLVFGRGGFWRVDRNLLPASVIPALSSNPRIVAVVPARDEADVISRALLSLLASDILGHVILVDDASTDGTSDQARLAVETAGEAHRFTLLRAKPLQPGWTGKLWALSQGVERALALEPDYLLLTDADIVHSSHELRRLVSMAEQNGYSLASLMVRLHCQTAAEKMLIPAFVYFFLQLYPPAWIRRTHAKTAGAAGGCILIRRDMLSRIGGLDTVRSEIIDDCALARAVKRSGGRVSLFLAAETTSIRPYNTFGAVGHMVARTAFHQLQHSTWLLAGTIAGLMLTYLIPVIATVSGSYTAFTPNYSAFALGLTAWLLMSVSYLPIVRFYRLSAAWAAILPAIALFYAGATIWSAFRYWAGAGGAWKGRNQDL